MSIFDSLVILDISLAKRGKLTKEEAEYVARLEARTSHLNKHGLKETKIGTKTFNLTAYERRLLKLDIEDLKREYEELLYSARSTITNAPDSFAKNVRELLFAIRKIIELRKEEELKVEAIIKEEEELQRMHEKVEAMIKSRLKAPRKWWQKK